MTPEPALSGREVLSRAIASYRHRVELGTDTIEAYGADAIDDGLRRSIELDNGTANFLRVLLTRGSIALADMPKGKDGEPSFISKIRHETVQEIVQQCAGALRGAFVAPVAVEPVEEREAA